MRSHSDPLKAQFESAAAILGKQGLIPKAPQILDEKSRLFADGTVMFTIDPTYVLSALPCRIERSEVAE